jgi:methylmalonyl-CoA/ethylmalonyl-CoA epimerase
LKFHHVGIVVENIAKTAQQYRELFGLHPISAPIADETQRVTVQFLASQSDATSIELIEPLPGASPARRSLEKGGGLNHLCFEVASLDEYMLQAQAKGVVCVCPPVPAAAFGGRRIAFLFYKGIGLVEFVEATRND